MNSLTGDTPGPGYYEPPEYRCWTCDGGGKVEVTEYLDAQGFAHEIPSGVETDCPNCGGTGADLERPPFFPY